MGTSRGRIRPGAKRKQPALKEPIDEAPEEPGGGDGYRRRSGRQAPLTCAIRP
jgi:hypothetical protein